MRIKYVVVVVNGENRGTDVIVDVVGPYDDMNEAYNAQDVLEQRHKNDDKIDFEVLELSKV